MKGGTVHSAQAFRSRVELVIDLCPVTNIDLVKRLVFSPSRPSFMFYPVSGRGRIRTCVTMTRLDSAFAYCYHVSVNSKITPIKQQLRTGSYLVLSFIRSFCFEFYVTHHDRAKAPVIAYIIF